MRKQKFFIFALSALLLTGCGMQTLPEGSPAPGGESPAISGTVGESPTPTPSPTVTPTASPVVTPAPPPVETPSGVDLLYTSFGAVPAMPSLLADANLSHDEQIKAIREWYYETENHAGQLARVEYDDNFQSYWYGGVLVKADVTEKLDADDHGGSGSVYHYYYHDGMPYFAFIENTTRGTQLRLYFWNGELIRWMESDGIVHETENSDYARYIGGAWRIFQQMLDLSADM